MLRFRPAHPAHQATRPFLKLQAPCHAKANSPPAHFTPLDLRKSVFRVIQNLVQDDTKHRFFVRPILSLSFVYLATIRLK